MSETAVSDLGWAIVELMGHVRLGGYVTEEERFGCKMGRIDVHGPNGQIATQYFGGSSVYRITPTTEDIAKSIGKNAPAPVHSWELPARSGDLVDADFDIGSDDEDTHEQWVGAGREAGDILG